MASLRHVAESGRTVVWSVRNTKNVYWDTVCQFLIGPGVPVRLDVLKPTSQRPLA